VVYSYKTTAETGDQSSQWIVRVNSLTVNR
jgi:hypothetical protein